MKPDKVYFDKDDLRIGKQYPSAALELQDGFEVPYVPSERLERLQRAYDLLEKALDDSLVHIRCTGPSCYWLESEDRQVCKCGAVNAQERIRTATAAAREKNGNN